MRIIYITSTAPFSSKEAFLFPEIRELKSQGVDVRIVPVRPQRGPIVHGDPAQLIPITHRQDIVSFEVLASSLRQATKAPFRILKAVRCTFKSRSLPIGCKNLVVIPKALWVAELAMQIQADHIHVHWGGTNATVGMIASVVSGIPWSMTLHRWDISENNLLRSKLSSARFARVISRRGGEELRGYVERDQGNITLLHVGVQLPEDNKKAPREHSGFRILVPASLVPVKGHRYLVETLQLLTQRNHTVFADFAGEGPLESDLRLQVSQAALDRRITFLGSLGHVNLLERMSAGEWDAVVLPSIVDGGVQEGIPVSLLEAMARYVPVVSTNTGGIPELLDGGAGLLVPERDSLALADAIELLATNREARERFARAGRKRVEESFAVDRIVARLIQMMQSAPAPKPRAAYMGTSRCIRS